MISQGLASTFLILHRQRRPPDAISSSHFLIPRSVSYILGSTLVIPSSSPSNRSMRFISLREFQWSRNKSSRAED